MARLDRQPTTAPARSARRPAGSRSRPRATTSSRSAATSEDVFSQGFICPKATRSRSSTTIRTGCARRSGGARTARSRRSLGRGVRRDRPRPPADPRRARPRRGRRLPRQPDRARLRRAALRPRRAPRARQQEHLLGEHRRPDAEAGLRRAHVRDRAQRPGARPRPRSYLLMLGANPLVSNGSLMTAPDMRGRMRAIRARGGKVVVIDPRRTRTAEEADEHHFIRPGTDALFLFALVHVIFAEGLDARAGSPSTATASTRSRALAEDFTPEARAPRPAASRPPRSAASRASSRPREPAACYGRIGTCTQEFGTLASWLVDVLNVLTGNLDRPGGAMFTRAAAGARNTRGQPGRGRGVRIGRWQSRVRGLPGGVRRAAGRRASPRRSRRRARARSARSSPSPATPRARRRTRPPRARARLARLHGLGRHLPERDDAPRRRDPARAARRSSARTTTSASTSSRSATSRTTRRRSSSRAADRPRDWEIMLRLAGIFGGQGAGRRPRRARRLRRRRRGRRGGQGRRRARRARPRRRCSPRSSRAAAPSACSTCCCAPDPTATASARTAASRSRTSSRARTASTSARSSRASPRCCARRPARSSSRRRRSPPTSRGCARALVPRNGSIVLVGRRELRSNNSWMHNLNVLVKGKERCTMHVHPDDADRLGLADGGARARALARRRGRRPGRGDRRDHARRRQHPARLGSRRARRALQVAATTPGTNSNVLADEELVDPLSGNAVLNGIPVEVAPL